MLRLARRTLLLGATALCGLAAACIEEPTLEGLTRGDAGTPAADPTFGDAAQGLEELVVDPGSAELAVLAPGATLQFHARTKTGNREIAAAWGVDVADIGTITPDGLFTATAKLGGATRVLAQAGKLHGSALLTIKLKIRENAGNIDPGQQALLRTGGQTDPSFAWLYPYDKTVFPRGLDAPELQFAGTAATALRLSVKSKHFDYEGFFGGSARLKLQLPQTVWAALTGSAEAADPVSVEVTKLAAGQVDGPKAERWTIAQGSLNGVVYYNSYDSTLAGRVGSIMKLRPGRQAEVLLGGTGGACIGCHTVSAQGGSLIGIPRVTGVPDEYRGELWNVSTTAAPRRVREQPNGLYNWGALTPDGTLLVTNAVLPARPGDLTGGPNVAGVSGAAAIAGGLAPRASLVVDPATGVELPAPGWGATKAMMPSFSPDGRHLVFNDGTSGAGHILAMMDFDQNTRTFSNYQVLTTDAKFVGWPSVTPDGKYVVYSSTSLDNYATTGGARSDLMLVHVASKTAVPLDSTNGMFGAKAYLPYGDAESHYNYEATLLPNAIGGYYWAVFTSRRKFGNTIVHDDPYAASTVEAPIVPRKKLWVAAISAVTGELAPTQATDLSHPAFYLPGQELAAGNMRAFWSLDSCRPTGATCSPSEDNCCGGTCRQQPGADGGAAFSCVAKTECVPDGESCTSSSECCDFFSGVTCQSGRCGRSPVR